MQERSSLRVSFRRAPLVAAVMLLVSGSAARAADTLTVDITRDGEPHALAVVVSEHGRPAIRLLLERGRTVWLRVARPVRRLVAGDLDRDGDVDLLATTDGNELVAWFNHGRGRFTSTVIHPRATGPLGPLGPAIERVEPPGRIDFGIGDDGALPAAERLSAPCVALLRHFSLPSASQTPVSAPYGPRAPPAA